MPTFFSYNALVSQRSSGYKSTANALAELIDNSFDAGATKVKVVFFEKRHAPSNKRYVDEIIVADNGTGMTKDKAQVCLQFGDTTGLSMDELVRTKKLGRFGYGLPNASISQCPSVGVYSRQSSGKFYHTQLDLDELGKTESIEIPQTSLEELPDRYETAIDGLLGASGTIVAWRKCDRLSYTRAETNIQRAGVLFGRLYRYLLSAGKSIELECREYNPKQGKFTRATHLKVLPLDPLFLMPNTQIGDVLRREAVKPPAVDQEHDPAKFYARFLDGTKGCKPTNLRLEDCCYGGPALGFEWKGRTYNFEITTSVASPDIQKPGIREGGKTEVGKFYSDLVRGKYISFVRADREICDGNFGLYGETDPRNRWWTVEIRFDPTADELLGVHNNKQGIEFWRTEMGDLEEAEAGYDQHTANLQQAREALWAHLSSHIARCVKAAKKEVLKIDRARPKDEGTEDGPLPEGTQTTNEAIRESEGQRKGQFTKEARDALMARLKEKYEHIKPEDIMKAVDNFDRRLVRGCILYCESDSRALWSLTNVHGFLIILINTNHRFFDDVLRPLREQNLEKALAAVELFISSLAWEEDQNFSSPETTKNMIELFRNAAGIHLDKYLQENELHLTDKDLVSAVKEDPQEEYEA